MMPTSLLLILTLVCSSCGRSKDDKIVKREGNPDYIKVDGENEVKMDAAITRSKKEIETFIKALQSPTPSQSGFSVKKPFPWKDGNETSHEHIWLTQVSFKDGKFYGRVGNEPVDVRDVKMGDEVTLDKSDASDWMIIDDGYLIGGYTILALRDQMPEAEQKEFDASFPYKTKKQ